MGKELWGLGTGDGDGDGDGMGKGTRGTMIYQGRIPLVGMV